MQDQLKKDLLQQATTEYMDERGAAWDWFFAECEKLRIQREEKISAAGEQLRLKKQKINDIDFSTACPKCEGFHPAGCCAMDGHGG